MKEPLLRKWAHAPWHCWLKEAPQWVSLFAELWAKLPNQAIEQILGSERELVILPPVYMGRVVRLTNPLLAGANILQLDAGLLARTRDAQLAILAHEFAHICTEQLMCGDPQLNDLRADHLVQEWGLGAELAQALAEDLHFEHLRIEQLKENAA